MKNEILRHSSEDTPLPPNQEAAKYPLTLGYSHEHLEAGFPQ